MNPAETTVSAALADTRTRAADQIGQILEERFGELSERLRRELAEQLNLATRRIRQFENIPQLAAALLDGAQSFCGRAAVFGVNGDSLRLEGARGVFGVAPLEVPLSSAAALASAVESREPVVAMRTRGELSGALVEFCGVADSEKFFAFPIAAEKRVTALLYADGNVEAGPLELLASVAGCTLEAHPGRRPDATPSWASLSKGERELHLRAQRFARVKVAEMRLYQSQAVKEGRTNGDLYTSLKEEIDRGRDAFRRDFMSASPAMVDYFHLELLRTLAQDDVELLGSNYPGPMV